MMVHVSKSRRHMILQELGQREKKPKSCINPLVTVFSGLRIGYTSRVDQTVLTHRMEKKNRRS